MTADELRHRPAADAIRRHRLVAVLRRVEPRASLIRLVDELADAGVRCLEITFDAAEAAGDLAAVRNRVDARGDGPYVVGAGTVLSDDQLDVAREGGADFAMSPVLDPRLMERALAGGMPFVPGAMTPTEIRAAWEAGATFVKLFPASAAGPMLVRELRGPLPHIQLVATGGIDAANARAFLDAGAVAVGIGGAITRAAPAERRSIVQSLIGQADR